MNTNYIYKVSIKPYWLIIFTRHTSDKVLEYDTKFFYNLKLPLNFLYSEILQTLRRIYLYDNKN